MSSAPAPRQAILFTAHSLDKGLHQLAANITTADAIATPSPANAIFSRLAPTSCTLRQSWHRHRNTRWQLVDEAFARIPMLASASIENDIIVAMPFMHNSIVPPQAKPIPVVSLDLPSTQKWATNSACKFTTRVTHKSKAIALIDHDVGPFIAHVTSPPSPLMTLHTLTSQRKSMVYARKVMAEGKPIIASIVVGYLDCADPFKNPGVLNSSAGLNTLKTNLDDTDLRNAQTSYCREYVVDLLTKLFEKRMNVADWKGYRNFSKKVDGDFTHGLSSLWNIRQASFNFRAILSSQLQVLRAAASLLRKDGKKFLTKEVADEFRKKLNPFSPYNRIKAGVKLAGDLVGGCREDRTTIETKAKLGPDLLRLEISDTQYRPTDASKQSFKVSAGGSRPRELNELLPPVDSKTLNTGAPRATNATQSSPRSIASQLGQKSSSMPSSSNLPKNTAASALHSPTAQGLAQSQATTALAAHAPSTSVPSNYSSMPPLPVLG